MYVYRERTQQLWRGGDEWYQEGNKEERKRAVGREERGQKNGQEGKEGNIREGDEGSWKLGEGKMEIQIYIYFSEYRLLHMKN